MMNSQQMTLADVCARYASNGAATAGGGGDNTEVDGVWLARNISGKGVAKCAKLVIGYTTTLGAGASLSFAVNAQDATDSGGTGAADTLNAYAKTAVATSVGGGTVKGQVEFDFNIVNWRGFLRSQITPDLSAANTDTVTWTAVWLFSGFDRGPASDSLIQMTPIPA